MINSDDIIITQPILCAIASIEEFKGRWLERGGLDPAVGEQLQQKALNESVSLINNTAERNNYRQLLEQITRHYEDIAFFENVIKKLHRILLADSLASEEEKGEYKKRLNPVYSKNIDGRPIDVFFETASPYETPQMMRRLLEWVHNCLENKQCHPLPVVALFMVHFLIIHPFQDGNSRLARALALLLLLKSGYGFLRYVSFEAAIEDNKEEYYRCLRQVQASLSRQTPDYREWLLFFLRTIQRLQKRLAEQNSTAVVNYNDLPELSAQIMQLAAKGRVTLKLATETTGANINTVKKHLSALVQSGLLVRKGSARGTWYIPAG